MGRARSGLVLAAAAVIVALTAAPGAAARGVHVHVNIKDQNGYQIALEAARSSRHVVSIASSKVEDANASAPVRALSRRQAAEVTQRAKVSDAKPRRTSGFISVQVKNHHAISTYGVLGTVTHNRLFAELGDFGRISLHFHLHHARTEHHGCFRQHVRRGTFTGRLRFRGERGYVKVDTRELRGKVEIDGKRTHRHRCGLLILPSPGRPGGKAESRAKAGGREHHVDRYAILVAEKESRSGFTLFAAIKEAREYSDFLTYSLQADGPVLIDREEYAEGKAGDFHIAKRAKAARIEPSPRALRGTGHYRERKTKRDRWTGSLATSMPGAPHIRLSGENFKAKLLGYGFSRRGS